jgi:hypothetical protein
MLNKAKVQILEPVVFEELCCVVKLQKPHPEGCPGILEPVVFEELCSTLEPVVFEELCSTKRKVKILEPVSFEDLCHLSSGKTVFMAPNPASAKTVSVGRCWIWCHENRFPRGKMAEVFKRNGFQNFHFSFC